MANPVFKTTSNPGTGTARKGYALEFKTGEYVFREGELGLEMYIINEGKVEILNHVGDHGGQDHQAHQAHSRGQHHVAEQQAIEHV